MHSLAETFRWQVEYRDHRQVPAVRLATTDAEVQIRLHRQSGEEVLCVGAAHEWVTVTDSIQVELPPHTLPEAGVYAIQAQITLPATLTSGSEQTVVVLPEQPELVRFEDSLFGA